MFKNILIAVDVADQEDTKRLLTAAGNLTGGWGASLHAVTVIPNAGMAIVGSYLGDSFEVESREAATAQLDAALAASGLEATPIVEFGSVYDCVLSCASSVNADLILIGAHQPELRDYLLGPNAARVVRHSNCSVLVLRH